MCQPAGPILLVEDETTDALLFRRALEKITKDPPIIEISNGDEAVEYLVGSGRYADRRKYPLPSLIVLDVKLPRRNGFEVLEWIRSQPDNLRFTPVLMLSSSDRSDDVEKSYSHGANSYMTKPFGTEEYTRMANAFAGFWLKYNEQGQCPRLTAS
jgi:CheY-like chemotaxis protein